ncbi:MAG: EAL domain-containing protein [Actinobacteria bacterium]|nr:EAL domain-containing protein [Actinomycetota bacterium]
MGGLAWRGYAAFGLMVVGAYWFVPGGIPEDVVYVALGLSGVLAIGVGIARNRPIRRLPWILMMLGQLSWVIGDGVDSWSSDVEHSDAFPAPADAFYLAAYPVLAVGLILLIRGRRPRRDVAGLLDSATLTAGLGVLSWVLLARPTLDTSEQSVAAAVVGIAYPVADILLVGLLIRLVTTSGGRTPAFRLLFAAVALLIAGDSTSAGLSLWSSSQTNAFDTIWLASYVAWGAAALHPTMRELSEPTPGDDLRFSRARLAALAAASLIAPGTLIVQDLIGARVDVWAVGAGSVVLFLLVVARMNVAITQISAANRERARLQDNLAYQAAHDSLTDLPNRSQALEVIQAALSRGQRTGRMVGLLFADLDGFKAVNDTFGHAAGDVVLCTVADRMKAEVRAGDIVARLGGDEFVVVLEQFDAETDAVQIATRLVDCAAEPIPLTAGRSARVGASIGLAISQDGSTDPERLLAEADTAVYRAKAAGRGRVEVFDSALRRELADRGELEAALVTAIENDELVLHYQPIVDLESGEVRGYEALVRWNRPGHGLVGPNEFIPTAEASSLICDIDAWVLNAATAQLAEWSAAGSTARTIAVNISGRHVSSPRVVEDVRAALEASGLPAGRLTLEITETVFIEDVLATHHLQLLRELGTRVSIDDFGTGYSSIARLQQLPVDVIKIDRSFLDTSQESSRALLELMIHAAHAFGLPVVVEGVEHAHQLDTLRTLNCEAVQGYYLSHPLPADEAGRCVVTP